ncbi:MAG: disulfide oxidoreductase [Alphaproteobacteria bacterium]|nr:disulfide oxidoreductase [Alphaproteobacteria bacterium]
MSGGASDRARGQAGRARRAQARAPEGRPQATALLGPTNTGKTHFAVERMLAHPSGIIGFPLRLLARENYDKIVRLKGADNVALLTGEEKIVPPNASYFVCTVESMPAQREAAFVAVDEIQLAADPERGHVFTDRLLHARGWQETYFLGADTMRRPIRDLVPDAEYLSRPRFSKLSYAGPRKITRLPPRSAVVAFSLDEVYALAEVIRRQRGGTAVVLGALSPRTRNAQVAMYQAGEVDYLVATDAIGMGLNMDVDHIAFASLTKFDGQRTRRLSAAEIAQIAGRAGRHLSDGTFGTTGDLSGIDEEIVEAVEGHSFPAVATLYWRSVDLDFGSIKALMASLETRSPSPLLYRVRDADDHMALVSLARDPEIARLADAPGAVRILWDVCQVPDFRKTMSDSHTRLLGQIFVQLRGKGGMLDEAWVRGQVERIDRTDGDIDTLMQRLAHIRTWTFVAHRDDWLRDSADLQSRARIVEDRLSDALHDRLTQRFVDRRSAALARILKGQDRLLGAVTRDGTVVVEGEYVGELDGFLFKPDVSSFGEDARALLAAARRALHGEMAAVVQRFVAAPDADIALGEDGRLVWRQSPSKSVSVARLAQGDDPLAPRIVVRDSDLLDGANRDHVRGRLAAWLDEHLRRELAPLFKLRGALSDNALSGPVRGLAFQVAEALGTLPRAAASRQVAALTQEDRKVLARLGVRLGLETIYVQLLLKPRAACLRGLLWAVRAGQEPPPAPDWLRSGRVAAEAALPDGYVAAVGYRRIGSLLIRADIAERMANMCRVAARGGPFAPPPELLSACGLGKERIDEVLHGLGFRRWNGGAPAQDGTSAALYVARRKRRAPGMEPGGPRPAPEADQPPGKMPRHPGRRAGAPGAAAPEAASAHPFAALAALKLRR